MTPEDQIDSLESSARAVLALYENVTPEQARWRPGEGKWSLLEVLCHLVDEESRDFRARTRSTLEDPTREWAPNDPQGWVEAHDYASWDLGDTLARFEAAREESLAWLRGLESPDWDQAKRHPQGFSLRAGDLLASWAAHDLVHIGQVIRTRLAWLQEGAAPYSIAYAV